MSIFKRQRTPQTTTKQEILDGGDYGIHFPWVSVVFLIIGILSEATDAFLLQDALGVLAASLGDGTIQLVSYTTGLVCFGSMAAIGYQSANGKFRYGKKAKKLEIAIWLIVGAIIAGIRVFLAFRTATEVSFMSIMTNKNTIMGILQFFLYLGSGLMTYSSAKQLTNAKLYEYLMAKRDYERLVEEVEDRREFISKGLQELNLYPDYAKRLIESKGTVQKNVQDYNKATKAMCAAKMAVEASPEQMDNMYEDAKNKEKNKW